MFRNWQKEVTVVLSVMEEMNYLQATIGMTGCQIRAFNEFPKM